MSASRDQFHVTHIDADCTLRRAQRFGRMHWPSAPREGDLVSLGGGDKLVTDVNGGSCFAPASLNAAGRGRADAVLLTDAGKSGSRRCLHRGGCKHLERAPARCGRYWLSLVEQAHDVISVRW